MALPQLFMPLASVYHGYKFFSEQNAIRKVADSAIDAGSDAFVKDNLVATKIERTDGTERLPAGSLVLEKANELLQH